MYTVKDFLPGRDDRAVFIGMTGSGKTTLAKHLIRYRNYVVVYDAKGLIDWPGFEVHQSLETIVKSTHPKLVYKPSVEVMDNFDNIETFFEWVYFRKNTLCYIDEVYSVVKRNVVPLYYRGILTRGRERNTQIWSSTQRPAWIPIEIISEAEHCFTFRLQYDKDRKRIETTFGIPEEYLFSLPKRHYYYTNVDGYYGPFTLNLKD